jgi:hypothetical protein
VITLSLKESGEYLGTIDEADLQFLIDQLEEESLDDRDYYITPTTIDLLEEANANPDLVHILREAVGDSDGVDIFWRDE